jgi:hypothetical protein
MTSANAWINDLLLSAEVPSRLCYSTDDLDDLRGDIRRFGFGQIRDALTPSQLRALQEEAMRFVGTAMLAQQAAEPAYRARIVPLGPQASALLDSRETRRLLREVFGRRFLLSPHRSTLTYYDVGDHLGPHLDKPEEECTVTISVYLVAQYASPPKVVTGLTLHVYGQAMPEDGRPIVSFPTESGSIVVGHGSRFWHERPRLAEGERVIGLTGCYSEAPTS